jgi:biotin-dependent carboxylase-like uncharacterized protein
MIPGLKVLTPGLHTTVQDLGRIGYQNIGVPVSGALDGFALRVANALVGNPQGKAALEILISGPSFEVFADTVRVALVGDGASLVFRDESERVLPAGQSVMLSRGERFQIVVGSASACCYLAVEGGIAVSLVLGSASTYVRAGIGGIDGRVLRTGDVVPLTMTTAAERSELRLGGSHLTVTDQPIRVTLGPQQDYFTDEAIVALLSAEYRVSKDTDRMGMRVEGPALRHRGGWDIVSDAIATGSIQVPGSGQPIILLADHQTTGGYPKIATVVSTDLRLVGRRRPGDVIRFVAVEVETAEALSVEQESRMAEVIASFEPVAADDILDLGSLYDQNLISGVVTGRE